MKNFEACIFVVPTPKGRARSTVINGHFREYTPKKTRTAESDIRAAIRHDVMAAANAFGPGVPLRMDATFYRSRPLHLPKRVLYPVQMPDLDNFEKMLMDALQKYAYSNDSQIVTKFTRKRFCKPGQVPRIELRISEEDELL
jgi:Holliday junction resolvase RusA-like endonuclease